MQLGLIGNYGATNAGDDAIKEAILQNLPAGVTPVIFSADPASPTPLMPLGIRSFLRFRWPRSFAALRRCDAVVLGGGGLFQDDRLYACFLWAWQVLWVRLFKKPLLILGVGVGPLRTGIGRWLTRWAFRQAALITVRDAQSAALLRELGLDEQKIYTTSDWAFLLPAKAATHDRTKNLFIISLRPWPPHNAKIIKEATELIQTLQKQGAQVRLVAMQKIRESDLRLLEPLAAATGAPLLTPSFAGLLDLMAQAEAAIGMRFHFLIAAILTQTPMVPVLYSPKLKSLCRGPLLSLLALDVKDFSAQKGFENLKILLSRAAEAVAELAEISKTESEKAQKNTERLHDFFINL